MRYLENIFRYDQLDKAAEFTMIHFSTFVILLR